MTVQDLINGALKDLGVLAVGETPSASESNDALTVLNELLASRSRQKAWAYQFKHQNYSLIAGTNAYTIGPSGSFIASPKPVRIHAATSRSGNFQQPMRPVSFDEFDALASNPDGATVTLPRLLATDNADPNINLRVFPTPNATAQMELTWWEALVQFTTLAQAISLPTGYERALRLSLAMELAPGYGRPVTQELAALASDANNEIVALNKSINDPPMPAQPAQ